MKYLKTLLLVGAMASASSMAFAQGSGATVGVDLGSVYNSVPYSGSQSFAMAGKQVRAQAAKRATSQYDADRYVPSITGYGSPD